MTTKSSPFLFYLSSRNNSPPMPPYTLTFSNTVHLFASIFNIWIGFGFVCLNEFLYKYEQNLLLRNKDDIIAQSTLIKERCVSVCVSAMANKIYHL